MLRQRGAFADMASLGDIMNQPCYHGGAKLLLQIPLSSWQQSSDKACLLASANPSAPRCWQLAQYNVASSDAQEPDFPPRASHETPNHAEHQCASVR